MPISFNGIPNTLRVPFVYVEFDNSRAIEGPTLMTFTNLVIGQRLAAGTVAALTPVRVTSAAQAATFFGAGSMLAHMLERQLENNDLTETWAVALDDDGGAAAATGTITFTGPATAAGTVALYIGGRAVKVAVASGDTDAVVAAAVAAAINADTDLAVTAAPVAGVVTLTARNLGAAGNDIDARVNYFAGEALPDGVTAPVVAMAGGATNPDVSTVWPVIGDTHYNIITNPYTDAANLTAIETELADRWGPLRQIEAMAIAAATGNHATLLALGAGRNSPHSSIMSASDSPTPPWEWAAAIAGVVSFHGQIDPARPFQTLPLAGVKAPAAADRFTLAENNLLLLDGISTRQISADGTVRIQRLITTYQTNSAGAPDVSYLDVNTPLTLGYLRFDFRSYILLKYPRHKLGDDSRTYGAGQAIMTPKLGRAEAIARARIWEELALVENIDSFIAALIVERNGTDNTRLDFLLRPDLVNQFRVAGVQIAFLL